MCFWRCPPGGHGPPHSPAQHSGLGGTEGLTRWTPAPHFSSDSATRSAIGVAPTMRQRCPSRDSATGNSAIGRKGAGVAGCGVARLDRTGQDAGETGGIHPLPRMGAPMKLEGCVPGFLLRPTAQPGTGSPSSRGSHKNLSKNLKPPSFIFLRACLE